MVTIIEATAYCPQCGGIENELVDSSPEDHGPTRHRCCSTCGTRYPTIEISLPGIDYRDLAAFRRQRDRERVALHRRQERGEPQYRHPGRPRRPEVYVLGVKVRLSDPEVDPRRRTTQGESNGTDRA